MENKLQIEEWREVKDFPGYSISNFGRVKGPGRGGAQPNQCLVKPWQSGAAATKKRVLYLKVYLYKGANRQRFAKHVHTLVLETFVGKAPVDTEACHWDGNAANCRLANLRWDTKLANLQDRIRHGTVRKALTLGDVKRIKDLRISSAASLTKISAWLGVSRTSVRDVVSGATWKHVQSSL